MGQDGETEPKMPKRTKKRTPRGRAKQAQALQFHSIEPLVVQKACQGTDSKLHQSLMRLLEPECSQQATLRTQGDMPPGTALRESTDVTEMPSTPPVWRGCQELLVRDSPEETTTREKTDVTELPSTPPASRGFEDLFVPDSPEEAWAIVKDTSRRLAKMPRTPPITTNLDELVVPDSPEETWARPHKSLRSLPPSTSFGELVVPESPEDLGSSKDPSHGPFKLRKTRLRNLHPELVNDRNKASLGRPHTELISCRTSKQSGKGSSKKAADSRNCDQSQHLDNRLPILAAAEKRPDESGSPRVTNGLQILSARSLCTPRGNPPAVQSTAMNETDLALGVKELIECAQSQGIVYKNEYLGDTLPLYVPDSEDPAPITPFSTIPGMRPVSSVALEQSRASLFDELVRETGTRVRAGARSEKDLHRDIQTSIRSTVGTPAPTTPFPIASGKPVLKCFRPLKKARAMVLRDELDRSESAVELKGAEHEHNASRAVPTSEMATDNVVPASFFVAGSGKSVLFSSTQLNQASGFVENRLKGSRVSHESAGAGSQRNLHTTQSSKFSNAEDARPINYPSMGSGKTLSAPRDIQTLTFAAIDGALPLTSLAIGNGNAMSASTDVQTPTVNAIDGAIPINSFVQGRVQPVPVSYVALEKVRKLLRDEFEGTEAEFSGPAHRGNLDIAAKALKFSSTVDAAPTNLSTVTMGKTFSASSDFEPISSKVVDNAAPITSLKETKTMANAALPGDQSTSLGSKFGNPEIYTELAGPGYEANVHRDVQTPRVCNTEDVPPLKASMAGGNTFDPPSCVTFPAIEYAVPINSFVTASGKSVAPISGKALERAKKLLGDQFAEAETMPEASRAGDQGTLLDGEFEGPENSTEFAGRGYQANVNKDLQTARVANIQDVPPIKSSTSGGKTFDAPCCLTSPAFHYAVPMTSFMTASGKPVAAVSAKALERAKKFLGDQFEETETMAEASRTGDQKTLLNDELESPQNCTESAGPGYQVNVHRDRQTAWVTSMEDVPLTKSSMADGKTFDAPSCVTSPAIDYAVPITSFVTASGKSLGAVSAQALERVKKFLGDQFEETETTVKASRAGNQRTLLNGDGPENYTECAGPGYQVNVHRDVQTSSVTSNMDVPPIKSSLAGGKVFDAPRYVTSPAIDYAVPITSFMTASGKSVAAFSAKALEKAKNLLGDQYEETDTMTKVSRSGFSTASGKPIPVSSRGMEYPLPRDDEIENDGHPLLQKATNHSAKLLGKTRESSVLGNSTFDAAVLPRSNGDCPPAKLARELAAFVPGKALEKGKAALGGDEKENRVEFERNSNLESLQRSYMSRNSGFTADRTLRPLYEIQAGCSILQSSDIGERFSPAIGMMDGSCSSQRVGKKGISKGNPPSLNLSRRIMTISNDAILTAKIRLAAGVRKGDNSEVAEETKDTDRRSTFISGSGRTVTISGEAIEKATTLLDDGMKKSSLRNPTGRFLAERALAEVSSLTPSFRTASGRTVAISGEAMSRAKDLLVPRGHSPTVLSSPDRRLNVQCCLPDEIHSSQAESVFCDVPASRVGPCSTVAPHPSQLYQGRDFERAITTTNKSTQLKFHNPNSDPSSTKPPSTARDYPLKNVRAFKPPRVRDNLPMHSRPAQSLLLLFLPHPYFHSPPMQLRVELKTIPNNDWRHPHDAVTSEGNLLTLRSIASSCDIQRSSSNVAFENHEHHQLQPLRPAYLKDRVCRGGRKLRAYIGRPIASEDLSSFIEVRPMTADAAEDYRIQHITDAGRWESVGNTEIWELLLGQGADILYASKDWVANHYKWIIWKLVSLERKDAQKTARKPVTLDTVLNELKYRYDTELSGWRSAIRLITEGDSSASRAMVLCVSAIRLNGDKEALHEHTRKISASDAAKIEVTDGWYRFNAVLDAPLTEQLRRGRLKVGQKLKVSGATLCCCSESRPPLEAFEDSFLTLHINGTYRAHQNHRLGFCSGSFVPLSFRIIKPDGGHVPKTYVGVTRVYPNLFKEISPEGFPVIRTARAEEIASNDFEQRRAKVVEEAILNLESSSKSSESQDGKDEGCRLFQAVERAAEPDILLADMNPEQLKAFAVYQAKRETSRQVATEDAVKEALQDAGLYSRDVKRFLKVRVAGLRNKSIRNAEVGQLSKEGTITIWDVSDEQNIVEGSVYCVSGLRPGLWGSSGNEDQLQLQSYRSTSWRLVPEAIHEKDFSFPFTCRAPTRLSELDEKYLNREFDVAATVLHVGDPLQRGSRTEQWVFVTDGSTALSRPGDTWVEKQILAIKVNFPSLAFAPVEPSLVGSVAGFCNLIQQPKDQIRHLWVAEASELSFFSCNFTSRPIKHLQAAADCVSKWATSSRWETDSLRHLVQGLLWEGSQ